MLEQDDRESEGVEVRPEEKPSEAGDGEARTGPRLFSELGTGITLHGEGGKLVVQTTDGGRQEVDLTAPGRRAPVTDDGGADEGGEV